MFSIGETIIKRGVKIDAIGRKIHILKCTTATRVDIMVIDPMRGKILHMLVFQKI